MPSWLSRNDTVLFPRMSKDCRILFQDVAACDVTRCIQLMLDFVSLRTDAWRMKFGRSDLIDTDPVHYWTSYITNPFIGLPDKTTHQWILYKSCMMELFGMWVTTASLERAFSMRKQLATPQKSHLKVSTTATQLLIKTHYKIYREKLELYLIYLKG